MATEARDRIAARDRVAAQRRTVEAPSTVRDDSDDEMIVSFPEFVFKEFIAAVAMTVFLVPFLDRNPSRRPAERKVAIILFALYMIVVVALVIIGTFFRGHEFVWDWGWVLGNPQTCGGAAC